VAYRALIAAAPSGADDDQPSNPPMPIPQVDPPGAFHLHVVLAAVTPGLLAIGTGLAARTIGAGRGARVVAAIGLAVAVAVQAAVLLPGGAAATVDEPLWHGVVRIGWVPSGLALVGALWAAWWRGAWRRPAIEPTADDRPLPPFWWCWSVAVALLLPVVLLPVVVLGCEPLLTADAGGPSKRLLRAGVATLATLLLPLIGAPIAMAATALVAALTLRGPWRWWLAAAAVAACSPPYEISG